MAVPFRIEPDPDTMRVHYVRIQILLRELMAVLRQMPARMIGDSLSPPVNFIVYTPNARANPEEVRDQPWVQHQPSTERASRRRRLRELQQEREQQQQGEQQRQLLPDLVASCSQSASPPPLPPTPPQSPPPQQQLQSPPPPPPPQQQQLQSPPPPQSPPQQQLQAQQQSAADGEDKIAGAVKLQVAVCPDCYYGKERKLKVIAVAKLDENGKPIRWTNNRDDEEPVVVENKSSKVIRRFMSIFQPSKIETSVLTAMFVIIGWKMFIKQ